MARSPRSLSTHTKRRRCDPDCMCRVVPADHWRDTMRTPTSGLELGLTEGLEQQPLVTLAVRQAWAFVFMQAREFTSSTGDAEQ